MGLKTVVLGTAGTFPTAQRNTTAIFAKSQYASFLLDAGEGFQSRLLQCNLDFSLDFIVITHFHTDHFNGLIPYLHTLNAMNRVTPLKIYSPDTNYLLRIMNAIKKDFCSKLSYPIEWVNIIPGIQYLHNNLSLEFFKVAHTVETYGVLIESTNNTTYNKQELSAWGTQDQVKELFCNGSAIKDGLEVQLEQFIACTKPVFRVVYSGDTTINSGLWDKLTDDTLLFHECTHYYASDQAESIKRGHTHYKHLISKKSKCTVVLMHLGSKITPELIKRIKKPSNYHFATDRLVINQNIKTNQLTMEWPTT